MSWVPANGQKENSVDLQGPPTPLQALGAQGRPLEAEGKVGGEMEGCPVFLRPSKAPSPFVPSNIFEETFKPGDLQVRCHQ